MGRRRRRAVVVTKAKPKLDTQFDCPYCGNAKAVEVKMNRPEQLGELKCRVCGIDYQTRINYLNEPVDVYSEWIDEAAERQAILNKHKVDSNTGKETKKAEPSSKKAEPANLTNPEDDDLADLLDDGGDAVADEFDEPDF